MVPESVVNGTTFDNMRCEARDTIRFGLCCLFKNEEIAFRTTTAMVLSLMPRGEQLKKLSGICHCNTTVSNLLQVCEKLSIPLVYDIQHHRCKLDDLSVEEATELAGRTW